MVTRNRASAKAAGAKFERIMADYLAAFIDDRIDRRVKTGANDRGDIGGLRHLSQRVVIECKDVAKMQLGPWLNEAEIERGNDDAIAGIVFHKRHGVADPGAQIVSMTARDFVALMTGWRPGERDPNAGGKAA